MSQAWRGDVPAIHALAAAGASLDLADGESGWCVGGMEGEGGRACVRA